VSYERIKSDEKNGGKLKNFPQNLPSKLQKNGKMGHKLEGKTQTNSTRNSIKLRQIQ
jgi:hypothetical protein